MVATSTDTKSKKRVTVLLSTTDDDDKYNKNAKSKLTAILDRFLGALCIGTFVTTWVSSLMSPSLLLLGLYTRNYILTGAILFVSVLSYLPIQWNTKWIHQFISYYSARYFNSLKIIVIDNDDGSTTTIGTSLSKQTFYAVHPHGAFCIGWSMLYVHDVFQNVRFCFSQLLYMTPFFRIFSKCTGHPGSAAKVDMNRYLQCQESVAIPPGGFEEASITTTSVDRLFLKKRTGFIRLALQYGVQVRPVYTFGEKDLYRNVQGLWNIRLRLNRYGIPGLYPWGNLFLPVLPKSNVNLLIVIGPPLVLPLIKNPTKEEVTKWHSQYVRELTALFDEYKDHNGTSNDEKRTGKEASSQLEIW